MKHSSHAKDQLKAIADMLGSGSRFLVSSHVNPDGDSVGSTCALLLLLSSLGKEAAAVFQDEVPSRYGFVPGADRILVGETARSVTPHADTVGVILDCGDLSRTGDEVGQLMARCGRLIVLDHHPVQAADTRRGGRLLEEAGTEAGGTSLVDSSASATGELIYYLVRELLDKIPEDIAVALYVAISTDTGSFRYSNTSPESLTIAGDLVAAGAAPGTISELVYDTKPIAYLRFLSAALGGLKTTARGRIAYLVASEDLLQVHGAKPDELEGLVDYARMVDTAVCAILFSPGAPGEVKVSFRSKGRYRVDSIAAHFGGGGHRCASGARVKGNMDDVVDSVLSHASAVMEDCGEQD